MTNTALITAFCSCALCVGPYKRTAIDTTPVEGRTIAAPRWIPLHTQVEVTVPGLFTNRVFTVETRTARRINGWDLYLRSHARARQFGKQRMTYRIRQ